MSLLSHLHDSLLALRSNALRSALTMLGIIVGVAAVIAVMAVGAGAQQRVIDELSNLGANLLLVKPGSARVGALQLGAGSRPSLTLGDAEALRRELPGLASVAPFLYSRAQAVHGNRNWATRVQGVTPDILAAREWQLGAGRFFSPRDLAASGKVAVLGRTVVRRLFGEQEPLGQVIRIANTPFTVIGLLEPKGETTAADDQDDRVLIPLSTARSRVERLAPTRHDNLDFIMLKVAGTHDLPAVEQEVRALLRQRHRLGRGATDDFVLSNLAELREKKEQASGVMGFWLTTVASVSLLVGGISIMNIMLVSVSERTREIGLRMAVGARRRDIRQQFLIEAVLLSLVGAIIGLGLGLAAAHAIARIGEVAVIVRPLAVILALGLASLVGVFFGLYPACRAARLNPLEALRLQ